MGSKEDFYSIGSRVDTKDLEKLKKELEEKQPKAKN